MMKKPHVCPLCEGTGKDPRFYNECFPCKGTGIVWEVLNAIVPHNGKRKKSSKIVSSTTKTCLEIINKSNMGLRPFQVVALMKESGFIFQCVDPLLSVAPTLKKLANTGKIKLITENKKVKYIGLNA